MSRQLEIVVLAYDCVDITWRCLVHLFAFAPKDAGIILFDNGSKDTTPKIGHWLRETGRGRYLRSEFNIGIFAAWNATLRALNEDPPQYVAFLNNDICIREETFPEMLMVASRGHPIVCAKQHGNHGDPVMDPTVLTGPLPEPRTYSEDYMLSAFMVDWSLFDKIGRFDENFLMEYADTDFCLRAFRAGHVPIIAERAFVYHGGSVTRKRKHTIDSDLNYSFADRDAFARKYHGDADALRLIPKLSDEELRSHRIKEWSDGEMVAP